MAVIETYRGFEIRFETNSESFQSELSDKRKKYSYPMVKKEIDEHHKDAKNFKPFDVHGTIIGSNGAAIAKVVGIRKDNFFVIETDKGKQQISRFDEAKLMLYFPENKPVIDEISELEKDWVKTLASFKERRDGLYKKLKTVTLADYSKTIKQ